jgi:hypothetical protein
LVVDMVEMKMVQLLGCELEILEVLVVGGHTTEQEVAVQQDKVMLEVQVLQTLIDGLEVAEEDLVLLVHQRQHTMGEMVALD